MFDARLLLQKCGSDKRREDRRHVLEQNRVCRGRGFVGRDKEEHRHGIGHRRRNLRKGPVDLRLPEKSQYDQRCDETSDSRNANGFQSITLMNRPAMLQSEAVAAISNTPTILSF